VEPLQLSMPARAAALADFDRDGLDDLLIATGDPSLEVRRAPSFDGGAPVPLPVTVSDRLAAADLDGDGDLDLLAATASGLEVLEQQADAGFVSRATLSGVATFGAQLADLDLDGRVDATWIAGDKIHVGRNGGGFSFLPYDGVAGPGTPLSLAIGDADGDGDLDLAATCATGTESTATYLRINKVK
jgi:hypothetical protein